jgi:adenylylsulfate reductase subunit B
MRASKDIMWTVKFRNGTVKRFKVPIRTTDEGAAVPEGGYATGGDINDHMLMTEPDSIRADFFTLKK